MVAQRQQLRRIMGRAVQLRAGLEEELQKKVDPAAIKRNTFLVQRKAGQNLKLALEEYGGHGGLASEVAQKKDDASVAPLTTISSAASLDGIVQARWNYVGGAWPNRVYQWEGGAPSGLDGIWSSVTDLHINAIEGNVHIKLVYANSNGSYYFYYYASGNTYSLVAPDGTRKNGYPTGYDAIDSVFETIHDLLSDWQG